MPELPEVETITGIKPHLEQQTITKAVIRQHQLRWPIPKTIHNTIKNQTIQQVTRRGKYIIMDLDQHHLIWHMGMTGTLRLWTAKQAAEKHDHVDLHLSSGHILRYRDPRRFGALLLTSTNPYQHKLIHHLGPEPLSQQFNTKYLQTALQNKKVAIKLAIMDSHIVVGVGNIYANEALFASGINPQQPANTVTPEKLKILVAAIKKILRQAIKQGGTTLQDFVDSDGKPGYFRHRLAVYGRGGEACLTCQTTLLETKLGQRQTVHCPNCQHLS